MFQPEGFSLKIFKDRYAFTEEETWEEACRRVARQNTLAESPDKQKVFEEKFYQILVDNLFVPGGRIWYNSGRHNPQLLNCFVLGNQLDSKEGWGDISREMIITAMGGGGTGVDFSDVRPEGAPITNQRGTCPGPVSLMELLDYNAKPIKAGGQRRVAQMFSLDLAHPNVLKFLNAKLEQGKLSSANISVRCRSTSDFIKAVKKDSQWELSWKGQFKSSVSAKNLWEIIVKNAYNSAEPGFLNWELVLEESNIHYIEEVVSTNPCQPGFAKVTLASGKEITMNELKVGDVLLNCNNQETKVTKKWSNGIKSVYAYGFNGGSFVGTENHKVVYKNEDEGIYKEEVDLVYQNRHIIGICTSQGYKVISSKVYLGEYEVFDITVDDPTHTYLTNGAYVSNCGEIALSSYDCCCLGHIVLSRFVKDNDMNWHELANTIRMGVRFLDNILTVNQYPLPQMKDKSNKLRRIGLGTTALADTLALLKYKYGSEEGNKFIDKLFRFISKVAYESSIMLAIEKGPFPLCNPSKHIESGFMKRMPNKIKSLVLEHGIRNCALLTQAPTGTVSLLSGNCSSGIESMFSAAYERRYWDGEERKTELVFHPLFKKFMDEGKSVAHFVGTHDLSVRDHLEVQKIVQKHIDNAVSKTINLPNNYSMKEMSEVWLEYLPHLKGTTFYRENTRGYVDEKGNVQEPPLLALSLTEAKKRYTKEANNTATVANDCPKGVCEV